MTHAEAPARIVIVGGGHVGMNVARSLRGTLRPDEATVTVIDPRSYMTYQPFLAEAAAGSVEPRHVVVPLREVLPGCDVLSGEVIGAQPSDRKVSVEVADGHTRQIGYDILVLAPGSWSKTLPIPGLAEHAVGFKTLGEAIYLRNHVLSRLDAAASTLDPKLREKLLTFVFIGGGYAGVEALAELADMAGAASDYYETISAADMRWVLVEAADRIMPEVSEGLGQYTLDLLRGEGFETHLNTMLESVTDGHVKLSDGTEFDADTVVWTAGVAPHPMLADTGLPLDDKGRVRCGLDLRVEGQDVVFAAGDCAAVPDISRAPTQICPPSAQHASRQAKRLAKNVVSLLHGGRLGRYKHAYAGSVASLGLYQGVAEIYGVKLKGALAWALHRSYHVATMPTAHRKFRISFDWLLSLPFRRQVVALGELHQPRREFGRASAGPRNARSAPDAEGRVAQREERTHERVGKE